MEQGGHPIMAHRKASSMWTQETKQSQDPTAPSSLLSSFSQWMLTKFRAFLFWVLAFGPVPTHVAFIMDGNRRYADSLGLARRTGHELGYGSLLRTLCDCFRLGIRIVTVYAFSVDNFRRPPEEVLTLMDLMRAKLNALAEEEPLLAEYSVRVRVLGDLSLLPEDVRQAASRAMSATEKNTGPALNICLAYSSVGEIVGAVQKVRDEILETLETHYRNCLDDGPFKEVLGAVQKARDDETLVTRLQTCLNDPLKEALSEQPKIQNETLETHHWTSLDDPVKEVLSEQQKKVQDETFETLKTHHRSSLDGPVEETPSKQQKVQDETFKTLETHPQTRLDDDPAKEPLSAIPKLQDETLETKSLHRTHLDSPAKEVFSEQQKVQEETFKPLEDRHQTHLNGPVKEALGLIQDKTLKTLHWTRLHGPIEEVLIGVLPKRIEERLYTFPDPPPDLLIRTSGETRLSDFLLWQTSFSHLVFCKVLWPDFSFRHLFWVILDYQKAYPHIMEQKRRLAKWMD